MSEPASRLLAGVQPCGCVVCTCEDDTKCHGCGASYCRSGNECVLRGSEDARKRRVYSPAPSYATLRARVETLQRENHALATGQVDQSEYDRLICERDQYRARVEELERELADAEEGR